MGDNSANLVHAVDDPHELLRLRQVAGHAALHVPSLGADALGDFPYDRSLDHAVVDDATGRAWFLSGRRYCEALSRPRPIEQLIWINLHQVEFPTTA